MSRSYKHFPVLKYAPMSGAKSKVVRKQKRLANKKVRRSFCHGHSYYKKLFPCYDIHDCVSYCTWKMDVDNYYQSRNEFFGILSPVQLDFNYWARHYLRK